MLQSEDFLESLKTLVPEMTIATRGGEQVSVKVEDLVIGDVIKLRFGDKVPADCRVIYTQGLKVDQTSITGESEATGEVECTVECTHTDPLKARNIIFSGSLVVDGSAQAVVIRTGDDTLVGGVVGLTSDVGKGESNLKKDIELFVFIILIFALVQAVGVLIASVLLGDSFVDAFVNGFIVIIIANVPQGLPSTIVACLVIVAERMAEVKIFVKKLDVIEALGACTMVCTDKTGILTLNEMRVENVWVMNERFSSEEFAQQNKRAVKADKLDANEQIKTLLEIAVLNSRVILDRKEANGPLVPMGDSVELGLYRFLREIVADRTGMDIEEYRSENPKVATWHADTPLLCT
jgi:sodium/potassium-transporting ATPase subunit alpha